MPTETRRCPEPEHVGERDLPLVPEFWIFDSAANKGLGAFKNPCRACINRRYSANRERRLSGQPKRYVGPASQAARRREPDPSPERPADLPVYGAAFLEDGPDQLPPPDPPEIDRAVVERQRRLESDHEPLRPEDFDDVSVGNDGKVDRNAARQKRQEYSRSMGQFASGLRDSLGDPEHMPEELGRYIANLAEQERRFQNRRLSRSVSLSAANAALNRRMFIQACKEHLTGRVVPTGYAAKPAHNHAIKRAACVLLSDLHLGSDLSARDNPEPFGAVEEARRLEYILRSLLDFKPQYRETTVARVLIAGDVVNGFLQHAKRDGIPLTEQKLVFWRYMRMFIGLVAQQYPHVYVDCQPGNHGRDTVIHQGRANSDKWDGHEWEMYFALREMCSELKNVTWNLTLAPVSIVDLFGHKLLLTHGDTEIRFKHPDAGAAHNSAEIAKINAERRYGCEFAAVAIGHWHTPRYFHRSTKFIVNGALVPPNGYARGAGYTGESCGQYLWEATEDYPVGDVRFLEVGPSQDRDEQLGTLIKPFRLPLNGSLTEAA